MVADKIKEAKVEFYKNKFENVKSKLPESRTNPLSFLENSCDGSRFDFLDVSNEITAEVIKSSNAKKSTGYDRISMRLIKENILTLSAVITHMINLVV